MDNEEIVAIFFWVLGSWAIYTLQYELSIAKGKRPNERDIRLIALLWPFFASLLLVNTIISLILAHTRH